MCCVSYVYACVSIYMPHIVYTCICVYMCVPLLCYVQVCRCMCVCPKSTCVSGRGCEEDFRASLYRAMEQWFLNLSHLVDHSNTNKSYSVLTVLPSLSQTLKMCSPIASPAAPGGSPSHCPILQKGKRRPDNGTLQTVVGID